jgi:FkbM family methyltransferase
VGDVPAEPFVSFAQNYEDVILWRVLKHVGRGFYVDVGAASPAELSVTKAFYDRGWCGINIEPHPDYYHYLLIERPRDINLNIALGDRVGRQLMHFVNDTGLSTLDDDQAKQRTRDGFKVVDGSVQVERLAFVWEERIAPEQPVHFLKVDVEGFERQVLLGNDWEVHRPWIVVVEATKPMTAEPAFEGWEDILTRAGYTFEYGDGLNRFYLAVEHRSIAAGFEHPPNVFDEFIRASEAQATERAIRAEQRIAAAEAELAAIQQSRSWRFTRPLRAAGRLVRKLVASLRRPHVNE